MMFYIYTKFRENNLRDIKVTERTLFVTDRQTTMGKTICLSWRGMGRHNDQKLNQIPQPDLKTKMKSNTHTTKLVNFYDRHAQ